MTNSMQSPKSVSDKERRRLRAIQYRMEQGDAIRNRARERYAAAPDVFKERVRLRAMTEKEKIARRNFIYRTMNRDVVRANQLVWREAHRDQLREYARQNRVLNGERVRNQNRASRSRHVDTVREANKEWRNENRGKVAALKAAYRASKIQRTPVWADKTAILEVYDLAQSMRKLGIDCHVDHIIPLRGKKVSGLHVGGNLQIVLAIDNLKKWNHFEVAP